MEPAYNQNTSVFNNKRRERLFYRNWITEGEPSGIVLIIHGFNSHSGYYQNFAGKLSACGYEVYALDLIGHGLSEGEPYLITDFNQITEDIGLLIDIVDGAHPDVPIFLFGHSAGGVFAGVYAVNHQDKIRGFICESFAFQIPAPAFALSAIKYLGELFPNWRMVRLQNEHFSRDQSVLFQMNTDPLLENEKQPARTMMQLLLAAEYLKDKMPELKVPLLIIHGTADKVTKQEGSEYFMEHASSIDKELRIYEGYYHDLINDKYNAIIIRDVIRWLRERA